MILVYTHPAKQYGQQVNIQTFVLYLKPLQQMTNLVSKIIPEKLQQWFGVILKLSYHKMG